MADKRRGSIITGPGGELPPVEEGQKPELPPLKLYWVKWFDPETGKVEKVALKAHQVQVYEDGMLIFMVYVINDSELNARMGLSPIEGHYVRGFRQHITFGEDYSEGTVN